MSTVHLEHTAAGKFLHLFIGTGVEQAKAGGANVPPDLDARGKSRSLPSHFSMNLNFWASAEICTLMSSLCYNFICTLIYNKYINAFSSLLFYLIHQLQVGLSSFNKKDGNRQLNVGQLGSLRPWDNRGKC